ncbi:aminopeptidase P family protein [Mycoplasmopsis phocirhinis]|uniref:Aminopeptidase P family protein n=1 Tax=Mycoplasmopsis phocirhinis TaxID=142650 RepID=A0A4P6MSL8_9BACT|nr:aminopeptidase P family protein [Mycoplasmopsis phocirhinis]QBF34861.1 aminopeptidase P family protein [Mycoplasmopsis phocirhinis]
MNTKYLNKMFAEHKVDALVSEAPQTRLWLTGIQTTDGYVIIEKDNAHLFVDGRYIEYAKNNAKNVTIHLLNGSSLVDFFKEKKYNKVAFEKDYLNVQTLQYLQKIIQPKQEVFVSGQELRILKSDKEIEILQKSIDISLKSLSDLKKWIKPGYTEKEVAAKLNYLMKLNGADKESFDEIVATGSSSAEPHHHPTDKKLVAGDLLKIDFGALYKGYSADITRTFILGENGIDENRQANNPKAQEILDIVLAAAKAGRDAVKPGIRASEIDKICREYIEKAGYGQYFVHGTGHGLGIDVHELPYVSSKSKDYILEPGMVITVEPGIYIEGLGGARNEDDVLVTETGRYVFSRPEERS